MEGDEQHSKRWKTKDQEQGRGKLIQILEQIPASSGLMFSIENIPSFVIESSNTHEG